MKGGPVPVPSSGASPDVPASTSSGDVPTASWTFLSNHAHVLVCLAQRPEETLREVAVRVGVTERAVQRIVRELGEAGILLRRRDGRRNRYTVDGTHRLRHPLEAHRSVQDLLDLLLVAGNM